MWNIKNQMKYKAQTKQNLHEIEKQDQIYDKIKT